MKACSILCGWLLLLCLPLQIFGQKTTLSNAHLVKTYTSYRNTDATLNHLNYFQAKRGEMHLSDQSEMMLTEESADPNGLHHFKYQQFHAGLPIFGCRYVLHEKDGKVVTATGRYAPQVDVVVPNHINPATAAAFARRTMNARKYDEHSPEPKLCFIDPAFPKVSEGLCLVYQVDLYAELPHNKRRYFVDAVSGKIVTQFPLILQEGVPSKAQTKYYGLQNIITDSIAPQQFVLHDPTRGEGIFILNSEDGSSFINTSSTWNLTDVNQDEVALDAHYCTQKYYDMMLADYNWQGQDGQGKALTAYVHGGHYANAYWDGVATTFGDGDCNYGPLTTMEVMGHEFTHGMVDYTSQLVYDSESGAINESLADMFGKMLERKADPTNFSWELAHSFKLGPNVEPFRVMDNPKVLEMPAYYQGEFWDDANDVHTNSSIGNLWFTMLVDGKQGINEAGTVFNVPALGVDKVGQIVFQTNKNYLTEGSDYAAFYQYSIDVAEALYGAGSVEAQAVAEAWKAVGVAGGVSTTIFDLGFSGMTYNSDTYCGLGQFLPVSFKIKNVGNVAYQPSMSANLILTTDFINNHIIPLNVPIAPGEVVEIEVNDWLVATEVGYLNLQISLDLLDDNFDNNYTSKYYEINDLAPKDLSVSSYQSASVCFSNVQDTYLFVTNENCETVPAGTIFQFTATDNSGTEIWSSPYTLTDDLTAGLTISIDVQLPVTNAPLTFRLLYADDPNTDNNEYFISGPSTLPITGNYFNDFETNFGEDGYVETTYQGTPTVLLQNNHYFAATGLYEDPSNFQHCADPLAAFNEEYNDAINASIHTCVDFSFSPAPVLNFDLKQYRNASTDTSNYLYSSMLQTKWTGNESGKDVSFGQPEGVLQHHTLALPAYFKGALDFTFYAEAGHWGFDPGYLDTDDFVFFDNLQLSAPTVATQELTTDNSILIAPNPARETARIQSAGGIKSIVLQNVSGQILYNGSVNASVFNLDMRNLANGFYLLRVQLADGEWVGRKLIKGE